MSDIKILDCTLRDGGYINNWQFGRDSIYGIISNLIEAKVDIIECGFIRDVADNPDSTVFHDIDSVSKLICPKKEDVLYAVMIEQHNYVPNLVCKATDDTPDIVRLTFRRNEWDEAKKTAREIIAKGYKVCIQPVGTASYDDPSLISLLQDVNELKPYAFYMVDTLGVMYRHEMRKFFYLIDNNLSKNILLGFHSHNNLQMSFSNAQEIMRLSRGRPIIIDSSCYGMGRGVGNLATELIVDYINNNQGQKYTLTPILNVVDKYLMPIYSQQRWGYDLPYFLSATFKCHPNYAAFLIRKETISIEVIEKILSLIPQERRNEFNPALIEDLYLGMQSCEIDDTDSYKELKALMANKEALLLGPGSSIINNRSKISEYSIEKVIISTNFIPEDIHVDALFISNEKRAGSLKLDNTVKVIATSNIKGMVGCAMMLNYSSLLGEGDNSDNAGAMLIRALKKIGTKKIFLAGFDGFDVDSSINYAVPTFKKALDYDTAKKKNENITKQLKLALAGVEYEFITPTKYEIGNI